MTGVRVDLERLLGDFGPGELVDRTDPARTTHRVGAFSVGDNGIDGGRERFLERVRLVGVVVHESTGDAVGDHLGDAADVGSDHGGLTRHGFEIDDPEGFVHRRADEYRCLPKVFP